MVNEPYNPYKLLLGSRFDEMPFEVRQAHTVPQAARGQFSVRRCGNRLGCLLGNLLGLPRAGHAVEVGLNVTIIPAGNQLLWERAFDGHPLRSFQYISDGMLIESCYPTRFGFKLVPTHQGLDYRQVAFWVFGIRMPGWLSPQISATVNPLEDESSNITTAQAWNVRVEIRAPGNLMLCCYEGDMRWE